MNANRFSNVDAEINIIGSIILNNELYLDVAGMIDSKDFYNDKNVLLYSAIKNLYKKGLSVDATTLSEELGTNLQEAGGISYLSQVANSIITGRHIKDHAKIVKEKSNLRNLYHVFRQALKEIEESSNDSAQILNLLQDKSLKMSTKELKLFTDADIIEKTLNYIDENVKNKGGILGLSAGIDDLDKAINGFQKKKLYIMAGRPGMCKSAFALNIMQNMNSKRGAYFSLEMGEEELGLRRLAMTSYVNSAAIERGIMDEKQWQSVITSSTTISAGKCYTCTNSVVTMNDIKATCKKMKMQGGIDFLIIDYLQLIKGKDMGDTIREQTTNICVELKAISKEYDIPVISLAQLSRAPEARTDHRPQLSDLKESGGIEENADVVMLLYRDEYYDKETEKKGIIECDIAKQRGGRTGKVKFAWKPEYQKVTDIPIARYEGKYTDKEFKK